MSTPPPNKIILSAQPQISASIQQALTASHATDPFADVMLSDVEEAAPESSLTELSDNDIEVV